MSTRANKELIRTLVDEAFNRHDPDAIDRAFAGRWPKDDEVLVKIDATTVSRTNCGLRSAKPFISRFLTGLRRPRRMILGIDRSYPLEQVVEATNYVETGQKTGNVVLAVANDRGT